MDNINENPFKEASQEELIFICHNMPRGMVAMIQVRTAATRAEVLYQLQRNAKTQKPDIIQAARDILLAITGLSYEEEKSKR
ncbi:MAG: hypothetical protein K0M50_17575 [Prolixibacteraceae bacterium]|nr:hypothetical protein [Prolixibacteraceae bacterium]